MNVFILCTGRCGSRTFHKACKVITNYSCGHETRWGFLGRRRLNYPDNHIEIDCRLPYYVGRLSRRFGTSAFYVHLERDRDATIKSLAYRLHRVAKRAKHRRGMQSSLLSMQSMVFAHQMAVVSHTGLSKRRLHSMAADYYDTVTANIREFIQREPASMHFQIENANDDFRRFWEAIGAEGDIRTGLRRFRLKLGRSDASL